MRAIQSNLPVFMAAGHGSAARKPAEPNSDIQVIDKDKPEDKPTEPGNENEDTGRGNEEGDTLDKDKSDIPDETKPEDEPNDEDEQVVIGERGLVVQTAEAVVGDDFFSVPPVGATRQRWGFVDMAAPVITITKDDAGVEQRRAKYASVTVPADLVNHAKATIASLNTKYREKNMYWKTRPVGAKPGMSKKAINALPIEVVRIS